MLRLFGSIHLGLFLISYLHGQSYEDNHLKIHSDTTYYHGSNQAWYISNFSGTVLHGVHREFYPNGGIKSYQYFVQGQCLGLAITYYESGQLKMIYELDESCRMNGRLFSFYENGTLESTVEYAKGVGFIASKENNHWNVISNIDEINNFISGYCASYFANGRLKEEGSYCSYYYLEINIDDSSDEHEYIEIRTIHSLKHGSWNYFDMNGNITKMELYENGNLINETKY